MRSRPTWIALSLAAALATVPLAACKKPGAATDTKVTPTAAPANPAAAAAAAQELFKAMKLQEGLKDTAAAMIDSEVSRNRGLVPYREVMLQWLEKYMTWEAMLPELTKMYTETFSEAELKQMATFYGSPAGQKSLQKLPELMQRTAMAGAQLGQPHSDELKAAMDARTEELRKQQGGPAGGGPGGPGGPGAPRAPGKAPSAPKKPQPTAPQP